MRNFINEEERKRILKMHINEGYNTKINESNTSQDPVGYAKSLKWGPNEVIQKGMRGNEKVKALQSIMSLTGSKGQKLATGYFGPITDGGLSKNYSDIYKSGQPVNQDLYLKLIDRLSQNITYSPEGQGNLVKGGSREDLPTQPQSGDMLAKSSK